MSTTVKELKGFIEKINTLIQDLPDDTLVLQNDHYSEFSFDINAKIKVEKHFTKVEQISNDGTVFYFSWEEDDFKDFLEDNPNDQEELKAEYKPTLMFFGEI